MVSGEMLDGATATFDQNNRPAVSFTLNAAGARRFGKVTGENIGRPFAIILDGKVVSAPTIQSQIFGSGQITGDFSVAETNELALVLRAGALPAPLIILEERSIGPGLGADSIAAGEIAAVIGIILVAIYMVASYGFFWRTCCWRANREHHFDCGSAIGLAGHLNASGHCRYCLDDGHGG